jgi:hypothetical protein
MDEIYRTIVEVMRNSEKPSEKRPSSYLSTHPWWRCWLMDERRLF